MDLVPSMNDTAFASVLVAIFNPANGCLVPDGQVLTVLPRASVPMRACVSHHFVSTRNKALKARYGWVEAREPFTIETFIQQNYDSPPKTEEESAHLTVMLTSIQGLSVGTPVAVDYAKRGIPPRMELSVHRVVFYSSTRTP